MKHSTALQLCRALFNVAPLITDESHDSPLCCPHLLYSKYVYDMYVTSYVYIGPQLGTHMTFIKRESSLTSSPSETQIFITVTLMTFYEIVMLQLIRVRINRSDTVAFCMLQFVFIPSFPLTLYQNKERTKKCKYYVYLFSEGGSLGRAREW